MVKAIDNIKAWAKENVQLITTLPETTILQVDARLKDILETSVDEKYYLSDEKTGALLAELEKKDKVTETVGKQIANTLETSGVNQGVVDESFILDTKPKDAFRVYKDLCPTLQANDYKEPKKVVEEVPLQQYTDGEGISYNVDANYAKGTSVGDIGKGRRTHVLESKIAVIEAKGCSTRTRSYAGQLEKLEVRKDFVSNSVTTVSKDSMVFESPKYRIRKL